MEVEKLDMPEGPGTFVIYLLAVFLLFIAVAYIVSVAISHFV